MLVLPSYYLPPISWFAAFRSGEPIAIELWENFQKQSLRSRCYIDSPSGRLALSLPIDKSNFSAAGKCLMRDVRLSSQYDWQRQHWAALETSYSQSPFFEYLQDDFRPIFNRPWTFLADLNQALTAVCLGLLEIDNLPASTNNYLGLTAIPQKNTTPYYQTFSQKHPFLPDLSIIDLLFNLGPEAQLYI